MKLPWYILTTLTLTQAFVFVASYAWFHALAFNHGMVEACVDCMNEGYLELAGFIILSALTTISLAYVINHNHQAQRTVTT